MSLLTDTQLPAVLLVDPIRYFRTFDITFDFWHAKTSTVELEKTPCFLDMQEVGTKGKHADHRKQIYYQEPMERLIALLEREFANRTVHTPRYLIRRALAQLMSNDLTLILGKMTHTLDEIELSLHDDLVLQRSLPVWRRQLGRWRNTLFHQGESLRELYVDGPDQGRDALLLHQQSLSKTVDRASRRVETVFQALMSSMSIVESERAIAEAEVVSKLTHLAFFFIPLSLVAGIFGMNINVSCLRDIITSTKTIFETTLASTCTELTCTATTGIPRPTDLVALAGCLHRCQRRHLCSALPGRAPVLDPADPGHRPQLQHPTPQ